VADPDAPVAAFSGLTANYQAAEQSKASRAQLMGLQSTLSMSLTRLFRSPQELAIELIPYALRMLSPDVKPVIVNTGPSGSKSAATASVRKASEKALVKKAVEAMAATGVRFERSKVEFDDVASRNGGWVFRMEPALDSLAAFDTLEGKKDDKVRYAVRSVLEMEWKKESARLDADARKRRGGNIEVEEAVEAKENVSAEALEALNQNAVKRDFFGRVVKQKFNAAGEVMQTAKQIRKDNEDARIWVSFHEGFSNAVRKPVTLDEFMRGL
jgi:chromosome transmission fidelity protein 18